MNDVHHKHCFTHALGCPLTSSDVLKLYIHRRQHGRVLSRQTPSKQAILSVLEDHGARTILVPDTSYTVEGLTDILRGRLLSGFLDHAHWATVPASHA